MRQSSGDKISLGPKIVTYNKLDDLRVKNFNILVYDNQLEVTEQLSQLDLKFGADAIIANNSQPILRQEYTSETGEFKFINLQPDLYSLYAQKENFFGDYVELVIDGQFTAPIPNLYILPEYDTDYGELWIKLKHNATFARTRSALVDFHIDFWVKDNYQCRVNSLLRTCGDLHYYTDWDENYSSQSIRFNRFASTEFLNGTYFLYVTVNEFDYNQTKVFDDLDLKMYMYLG